MAGCGAPSNGDLGHQHTHVGCGNHRVLATRDITARGIDRNILVAQDDARHGLDLDILHAVALDLGEVADLLLGKADVLDFARRQFLDRRLDVRLRQREAVRIPAVELAAVVAYRLVAARLDILEDGLDGGAHLHVIIGAGLGILALFEVSNHVDRLSLVELRGVT